MIEILFWTSLAVMAYVYFGYPLCLLLAVKCRLCPVKKGAHEPAVTVALSAWNEEDVIEKKLRNVLSLDYPAEKMEIIVGSDGSDDHTNDLVRQFQDERIRLLECCQRRGKMATLNDIVAQAQGEVIVFTDARQNFAVDAIRQLVANFADSSVGCVSGELVFGSGEGSTAQGINLYWKYEKFLRAQESKIHSMLGATGAIYAIRKELFCSIPDSIVLDDVFVPMQIIRKGYRAVFDESAKAYDDVAESPKEEYRRKVRTLFGNYQIFTLLPWVFVPWKSPVAVQFFSHKFLRLMVPFLMMAAFVSNLSLWGEQTYRILLILQIVFYGIAVLGALSRHQKYGILKVVSKLCYVPYVFCLLNFSALAGWWRFVTARQQVTWKKARIVKNKQKEQITNKRQYTKRQLTNKQIGEVK